MFDNIPRSFSFNVAGNDQKPISVRLTIGENVLMLGLALLAVLALKRLK